MSSKFIHHYANFIIYHNSQLLTEYSAFNLIEKENEILIIITSAIPEDGFEINPNIGSHNTIAIFGAKSARFFNTRLIEKKVSGSVGKDPYQLLTYRVDQEIFLEISEEFFDRILIRKYNQLPINWQ